LLGFDNGGRLVQSLQELPDLSNAKHLYLDVETTSGNSSLDSLNPWHHCEIAGVAVTADKQPGAWYIPVRHKASRWNLPLPNVQRWLKDTVTTCDEWVNHNIKYDAHCCTRDGAEFRGRLFCTLTHAKLVNSDRHGYGLDDLSKDWLHEDISYYEQRVKAYLLGVCTHGSKDYGDVPGDILGEYACQDVITNRRLHRYEEAKCPDQCRDVWETETLLTPVLYDMEVEGMRVRPLELQMKQLVVMHELLQIEEQLHKMTGTLIRPHVNSDCYDLLCTRHGLPVLGWTDTIDPETEEHNPSFDKDTLKAYLRYPTVAVSAELTKIVQLMLRYRNRKTLLSFFIEPYLQLNVDGVMHPMYNQCIRTGRMSCKKPNAQQLSLEAKDLVHPDDGRFFLSADESQIEFRLIVHYINDANAIAAYAENPDTDFHQWVAEMCGIPRKPAKNVNFCMGYGGGRERVLSMLSSNMDLVGELVERAKQIQADPRWAGLTLEHIFDKLAQRRAVEVYDKYHNTLPGLKRASWRASDKIKSRGYVFNAHGRHRHLPEKAAFRAFNSVIQSDAADVMKEQTVAVAPRYNQTIRDWGIRIFASVHDETAFSVPQELRGDERVFSYIASVLETTRVSYRVPFRVSMGASDQSWAKAGADENKLQFSRIVQ